MSVNVIANSITTYTQFLCKKWNCCLSASNDIHALALDYPLETCSGNGGGVRVADWYHPYKNMLTEEQSVALEQLLLFADIRQAEVIRQILAEFSSQTYRQKYAKTCK